MTSGPSPSVAQERWFSAVAANEMREVSSLLRAGASCDWSTVRGQRALHLAIEHGHDAMAVLLMGAHLAQGVPIDHPTTQGLTPLGLAIEKQNVALVDHLVDIGALPRAPARCIGGQPASGWLAAAYAGATPILRQLSQRVPSLVESVLPDGRTALHLATSQGHATALSWLLRRNIDHSRCDEQGRPPWAHARLPEVLDLWEAAVGRTVLGEPFPDGNTLIHVLLTSPPPVAESAVNWVLDALPELAHRPDVDGRSPLALALAARSMAVVDRLVAMGATWHAHATNGSTPFQCLTSIESWPSEEKRQAWLASATAERWDNELPGTHPARPNPRL